jgi:uncharacterized membrane protein (Fun14 family)
MDNVLMFLLKTVGLGLITGFVFGFLFKRISKIVLFIVAVIVVVVFVLGHNEVLDIAWLSIKDYAPTVRDYLTENYEDRVLVFLQNTPFTLGVIVGVLYGLKKG